MINEMMGLRFQCTDAEIVNGTCIYTTGEAVLDTFGLPHGDTGASPALGRFSMDPD